MRAAIVVDGVVVNVVEASQEWITENGAIASDTAGPGDLYANGIFTPQPAPPAKDDGSENYKAMIRRRAADLPAIDAVLLLKTIGE